MDLTSLKIGQAEELVGELSPRLADCRTVEQACSLLCEDLYRRCRSGAGAAAGRSLLLSRVFLSVRAASLEPDALAAARARFGPAADEVDLYLALLGTHGDDPAWNDPRRSAGHRAILLSRETVAAAPMLSRCFQQIGLNLDAVLSAEQGARFNGVQGAFGIFHIPQAEGSPCVPAQDEFVRARAVRSIVGCATVLPDGAVSIWIGFSRHTIPYEAAIPLLPLMPSFWHLIQPLYRRKALYGA